MPQLSIRGLDDRALAALKRRAEQHNASVNSVVLELIEGGLGLRRRQRRLQRHNDLDALAGTWKKADAAAFAKATAAFAEVDPALWK